MESCCENPSVYDIQKFDDHNYNINVFEPEPLEDHKSIDECSNVGSVIFSQNQIKKKGSITKN